MVVVRRGFEIVMVAVGQSFHELGEPVIRGRHITFGRTVMPMGFMIVVMPAVVMVPSDGLSSSFMGLMVPEMPVVMSLWAML